MRLFLLLPFMITMAFAQQAPATEKTLIEPPPSNVWLVVDVNPLDFTWSDLGLEQEKSFTLPLLESWQKWLQTNQMSGRNIQMCLENCLPFLSAWQDQESTLITQKPLPAEFANGLIIKFSYVLRRDKYSGRLRWEGSSVLMDINSKMVILSSELPAQEKTWIGLSQKSLNSKLATRIFKHALYSLKVIATKLPERLHYTKASRLVIKGARQMGDILKLLEEIKSRGNHLGLLVRWDYVQQREARFLFFYRGEEKTFTDLLSQLKELKSLHSYEIRHEKIDTDHVLNLVAH